MPDWDLMHGIPVKVILEYVHTTVGTDHYKPAEGHSAGTIAKKLAKSVEEQGEGYLRLGETIERMECGEEGISLKLRKRSLNSTAEAQDEQGEAGVEEITVDRIVIATQASAAKELLGMLDRALTDEPDKAERRRIATMRKALESVEYRVSLGLGSLSTHFSTLSCNLGSESAICCHDSLPSHAFNGPVSVADS